MKIRSNLIKYLIFLSVAVSPCAIAQNFLSEKEMLDVFSGATVSGILASGYSNLRWTQIYGEFEEGNIEGEIKKEANKLNLNGRVN